MRILYTLISHVLMYKPLTPSQISQLAIHLATVPNSNKLKSSLKSQSIKRSPINLWKRISGRPTRSLFTKCQLWIKSQLKLLSLGRTYSRISRSLSGQSTCPDSSRIQRPVNSRLSSVSVKPNWREKQRSQKGVHLRPRPQTKERTRRQRETSVNSCRTSIDLKRRKD